MGGTGTQLAEDPSGSPRLTAELMKMNYSIGKLVSAQEQTAKKVDELHQAVFIGNHNLSIIQWLMKHDNQIARITGEKLARNAKTIKIVSFSGLGTGALLLALKVFVYLVTNHWPNLP